MSTMGDQGRQQTGVPFGGGVRIAGAATWGGLHSCICFIQRKEEGKKEETQVAYARGSGIHSNQIEQRDVGICGHCSLVVSSSSLHAYALQRLYYLYMDGWMDGWAWLIFSVAGT
jgi:hypothetical protein